MIAVCGEVKEVFQDDGVKLLKQVHEQAINLEKDGQLSSRLGTSAGGWKQTYSSYMIHGHHPSHYMFEDFRPRTIRERMKIKLHIFAQNHPNAKAW